MFVGAEAKMNCFSTSNYILDFEIGRCGIRMIKPKPIDDILDFEVDQ